MTYRDDYEFDDEPEPDEVPRRRRAPVVIAFIVLALAGTGSAFVWHAYGGTTSTMPSLASDGTKAAAQNASAQNSTSPKDFDDYRQKTTEDLRGKGKLIEAQQAQIKALTDTVTQLSTRLGALEKRDAEIAQAQAQAAKALPKAPPKAKPKPPPAPTISTGGAPLPTTPVPTTPEAKR